MIQREERRDGAQPEGRGLPFVHFAGALVALGPLHRHLPYQEWLSDFAIARTNGSPRPLTHEQALAWYEQNTTSEREVWFAIYEVATGRPIGLTELSEIDTHNRRAEFGITIGEAECRGKGYGTEATRLMLDYAFMALSLHSVMLTVNAYNLAGLHAYQKAGFREFGRRRECRMMGGKLWDKIYMDCLATEFMSPVLGRVFIPDEPRR